MTLKGPEILIFNSENKNDFKMIDLKTSKKVVPKLLNNIYSIKEKDEESIFDIEKINNKIEIKKLDDSLKTKLTKKKKNQKKIPSMTLQDLQSSLINSINENYITQAKTTETISFDKYADLINTSMKKYQLHVEIPKDIDSDTEEEKKIVKYNPKYITLDDKNIIKKVHDLNSSFITKYTPINSDSNLKVNFNNVDYQNPYQSIF